MKSQVEQHLETKLHTKQLENRKKKQTFIDLEKNSTSNLSVFLMELCIAIISVDIPFHKLSNPQFKPFIEKYTSKSIPRETTLRKTYLPL